MVIRHVKIIDEINDIVSSKPVWDFIEKKSDFQGSSYDRRQIYTNGEN